MLLIEVFTKSRRWLELVAHKVAPADGVDVWRLVVDPLVELILPAVKVDEEQAAHTPLHGGHTHQSRLHQIHRLQLHVGGEAGSREVLNKDIEKRKITSCDKGKQTVGVVTSI